MQVSYYNHMNGCSCWSDYDSCDTEELPPAFGQLREARSLTFSFRGDDPEHYSRTVHARRPSRRY